jgi:hypothetical protein
MKQEEITGNSVASENPTNVEDKNLNPEEAAGDLSPLADSENADNLPVESIGSYGRIDDLLKGEGTEKHGRADSEN